MGEYTHYRDALVRIIYHQIWIMLSEFWVTHPASPHLSRRLQAMLDWLQEHLAEPVSRKESVARVRVGTGVCECLVQV